MTAPDIAAVARGLTKAQRAQLPKTKVFKIMLLPPSFAVRPMTTRGANYAAVWFWRFHIAWRMPWLERPARQLHPEIFMESNR